MKKFLSQVLFIFSFILLIFDFTCSGQVNSITVLATTNGVLLAPTNIFPANIAALTNALNSAGYSSGGGGSGGSATNVYLSNGGTNLVIVTNSPGNWTINTSTNVSLTGLFTGNFLGFGGGVTGIYSSSIVGSVASALLANTASYATNAGSATNITGATGSGLDVGGIFSGSFAGTGGQLVGLTGANVVGSVGSATNAQNATNIYGAGLVTMTNAALTVFTNSILPGNQISAPLSLQSGVTLSIQTNGSNPYFISTNWFGLLESQNTAGDPHGITNSSFVSLYCGYPTNVLSFGYLNSYVGYTAVHTPGYPAQTEEERMRIKIFGQSLGLWMEDGNFWYLSDPVFGTPQNWVPVNEPSFGNQLFYTFSWPVSGFHTLYLHLNGGNVCGVFVPSTNSFVNVPHPTMTGIIVGDSVTDGAAGYGGHQLWGAQLEDNLIDYGINLVPQGEGGTGYITTNLWGSAVAGVPFIQRLTNNIAAFNPNFVIWAGGINDPTNGLFSAATNCYGSLKALLPNCKQLVIAPWGDFNNAWDYTNWDQIISNAAAVYGLPVIYPDYSAASAWISGSYNVPGSGNAVTYASGNGPHPNALGHQFYARMLQNFVLTNLLTNATPILW
ncbi:MAG: SGNH/GDSL hydrolase family protein [Patescibacteria group bacterium]|nr:SGNH/GDSL hydrolase family protein [Patescibacteria group bacterium]